MSQSAVSLHQPCFLLKASFFSCPVLHLLNYDLGLLAHQLQTTVANAPNFFAGSPIIIDLTSIKIAASAINFIELKQMLLTSGMVPIGIRSTDAAIQKAASAENIPTLAPEKSVTNENVKKKIAIPGYSTKLITTPIRSGTQVYAKNADLIVLAAVSHGAELLADGHIHVYGALRGRALAGVQGNTNARIFCRALEAELISIAGYYLVNEDIERPCVPDATIQVYLQDKKIRVDTV